MSQNSLKLWEASVLKLYQDDLDKGITEINKGFVSGKRCMDCVKELYDKIKMMKKGYLVFIDCKRAFPTSKRETCLNEFGKVVGKGEILKRLANLYRDTEVQIQFKFGRSKKIKMIIGLITGSKLSPKL